VDQSERNAGVRRSGSRAASPASLNLGTSTSETPHQDNVACVVTRQARGRASRSVPLARGSRRRVRSWSDWHEKHGEFDIQAD
jgi:hypothetical protein